jgi:outer membrane translocation and assembly module TamA
VESQRWLERPALVRLGVAAFMDMAASARGFDSARSPMHADVGVGVRLRVPGSDGMIRADYAHGVRDGHDAFTVGLMTGF